MPPSTVTSATRPTGSSPTGVGDPSCPATNRSATSNVVADSTRFAPIQVGDNLTAMGNYETVNLVSFLSAWSVQVAAKLLTRNIPTRPDYMEFSETRWDTPGFPLNRVRPGSLDRAYEACCFYASFRGDLIPARPSRLRGRSVRTQWFLSARDQGGFTPLMIAALNTVPR